MQALTLKSGPLPHRALYVPDYLAASLTDIDWAVLYEQGIEGIAVDLDSTLVAHGSHKLTEAVIEELARARPAAGILKLCLATNRRPGIILHTLAETLGAAGVVASHGVSRKPAASYFDRVTACLDVSPRRCAMIGDKLWQDIYGGNRVGFATILVEPHGPAAWFDRLLLHRWRQTRLLAHVRREYENRPKIAKK